MPRADLFPELDDANLARDDIETLVVGAGVVGLACARALAEAGHEVLVVEKNNQFGEETSARNSEVVHAGIYYPKGSLKAQFCVAGRQLLYAYCAERGIACDAIGKLVVACDEAETAMLAGIQDKARGNGVDDIRLLTAAEAQALEPALSCTAALLSPSTGIVDSHGFMLSLLGDLEAAGGFLALEAPLLWVKPAVGGGFDCLIGGPEPMRLHARRLVNAAGLSALMVSNRMALDRPPLRPSATFAKGNYFRISGRSPFKRLIYPVPVKGGLGVHLTVDRQGACRFGPDTEFLDLRIDPSQPGPDNLEGAPDWLSFDYAVDPQRADSFYAAVRRYWPDLADGALEPDYSGMRPKVDPASLPPSDFHTPSGADFVIQGPDLHGLPGLVELFGIESPGLTSSLAIADHVRDLLAR
jgi:L-2-hydroxyglutarate oxidase LhgO